jgi:hypothetical protein
VWNQCGYLRSYRYDTIPIRTSIVDRDCVIGISSGHTSMIRYHDVHRWLCYWGCQRIIHVWHELTPITQSTMYVVAAYDTCMNWGEPNNTVTDVRRGSVRDVHRWLCYWGQLRPYRYDTLAQRTSSTVLLRSAQLIQVWYAGTTYIFDCVIRGQFRSYRYRTSWRK